MLNCLMRGSLGRTIGAAVGLVMLVGCGGETVTPSSSEVEPTIAEGVSWALAERRAATLSDIEYAYRLTVPRQRETPIQGTVLTEFVWKDDQRRDLVLDFLHAAERVRTVRANGLSVAWRASQDHLIVPASALTAGERNEVAVEFTAGDEALNRSDAFLYTLFVPDRAHFSLPLFDQPNLKARFALTLEVPDDWEAVANGQALDPTPLPPESANRAVYRFAQTQPISTYLFAFAVGDFQIATAERDGRMLRMFYRETDVDTVARNRDAIFDLHAASLAWLEDYTQIAYPFGKFDFVLLPPFQYGGMEHPGAVFYRESSLLLDESATQGQFLGRASLIAHETAHMWFGDLVTMNWFDDVWTKEVFANFMAAKIVHPSFPDVNHDLRFFLAHHDRAYAVDRTTGANPIHQPLENLREAGALYGPIIYEKAPIVMRQLERLVGEESFRDGLREYLDTFRYGNATWPDLIQILDTRSDRDLAAWSAAWVEEPGRPVIDVVVDAASRSGARTSVTLHQTDPDGRGRLWPQQLEVLLAYDEGDVRVPASLSAASVAVDVGVAREPAPLHPAQTPPASSMAVFDSIAAVGTPCWPSCLGSAIRLFEASAGGRCGTTCSMATSHRSCGSIVSWRAWPRRRSSRTHPAPARLSEHHLLAVPQRRPPTAPGWCPGGRAVVRHARQPVTDAQGDVLPRLARHRRVRRRGRAYAADLGGRPRGTRREPLGDRLCRVGRRAGATRGGGPLRGAGSAGWAY